MLRFPPPQIASAHIAVQPKPAALTETALLAGNALTVADSFLFPHLLFFSRMPEGMKLLGQAPSASAWLARMTNRKSYVGGRMSRAYEAFHQLPALTELA